MILVIIDIYELDYKEWGRITFTYVSYSRHIYIRGFTKKIFRMNNPKEKLLFCKTILNYQGDELTLVPDDLQLSIFSIRGSR